MYPMIIGQFRYLAGYRLQRSSYDSFLLMYLLSGSCRAQIDGKVLSARQGQTILLDCYKAHSYEFPTDSEVLWLHFDGPLARDYYEILTERQGNVISLRSSLAVTHELNRILEMFRTSRPIPEAEVSRRIIHALNEMLRADLASDESVSRSIAVDNALVYINEHFRESVSLELLARNSNLSPYYFTRVFTAETGMTPHRYLIAVRINYAKYLLQSGILPVKEIAFESGFNSESSFCSTFRKWEGMTPGEYRTRRLDRPGSL